MAESVEIEKKHKDPSGKVILGICIIMFICIYSFRDILPHGKELWWAWMGMGIGLLLLIESFIREFNYRYRWSTHLRALVGVVLLVMSGGLIYGFRQFMVIYVSAFAFIFMYTVAVRHKLR